MRPWRVVVLLLGVVLGASGPVGAGEHFLRAVGVERFKSPVQAPEFSLPTPEGKVLRLNDFRGKVVFLNFWATWCPACREEMPSMERLHREFKDKGLMMVAVDLQERPETVAGFMKGLGLTFPAVLDRDGKVSDRYKVRFIPTTFLVGKQGELLGRVIGPKDWTSLPARQLIASLLDPGGAVAGAEAEPKREPSGAEKTLRDFLDRHWAFPISPQGKAPARFAPLEASLDPRAAGPAIRPSTRTGK